MKRVLPAVLVCSSACISPVPVTSDAPGDVAWAALIELAEPLRIDRASGLFPWPAHESLPLVARTDREVIVAAFTSEQLAHFALPAAGDPGAPLRAADGCEDRLPPPAWAGRWTSGTRVESISAVELAATLPPLTSTFLITRCTTLDPAKISADVDCVDHRCAPSISTTGPCTFELALPDCNLGPLRATLHADRAICLDVDPASRCTITAHVEPEESPFDVFSIDLFDAPAAPFMPANLAFSGLLSPDILFEGYAFDLIRLGDELAVAAGDGSARSICRDDRELSSRVLFFDVHTLLPTRTATAPACLSRFAAVPGSPDFVAVFADRGEYFLGRFDASLREQRRAPIDDRAEPIAAGEPRRVRFGEYRVLDLELVPERNRVVITFNPSAEDGKLGDGGNPIFTYALDTLEVKTRFDYRRGQRWTTVAVEDGLLALANRKTRAIDWFHVDTATAAESSPLVRIEGLIDDDSLLELAYDESRRAVLVAATRDPLVFAVEPGGRLVERSYVFDMDLDPVAVIRAPRGDGIDVVAGVHRVTGGFEARVARIDAMGGRFLPGTERLGEGIASKLVAGADGDVVALLPWSAKLARVRLR